MIEKVIVDKKSVPVTNNRKVLSWMVEEHQMRCFKENKKSLMSDLRNELFETFGKQNKTITREFKNKLWTLKYNDLIFNVYSAANKGTSIEICDTSYDEIINRKIHKEIINFLEELYKKLNLKTL